MPGDNSSFIEIYDNLLSQEDCDRIISAFENSPDVDWGKTSGGFEFDYKKCKERTSCLTLVDLSYVWLVERPLILFKVANTLKASSREIMEIIWRPCVGNKLILSLDASSLIVQY